MSKVLFLVLCIATAATANISITKSSHQLSPGTLGIVNPVGRCGGVGTPIQLRISDCDGYCRFQPGRVYDCEKDFMPSSAAESLSLRVEVCQRPFCYTILTAVIPNSFIMPGFVYTAKYSVVPNDVFSGQSIQFYAYIYHTDNSLLEVCVSADVDIL